MSTVALLASLERIKNDLNVECTCHLHHGVGCPKRIAEMAIADHAKEPDPSPPRPDIGFNSRSLHKNAGLVQAVAEALGGTELAKAMIGDDSRDGGTGYRRALLADAERALAAVDAYEQGRTP